MPKKKEVDLKDFCSLSQNQLYTILGSSDSGLTNADAKKRLEIYGPNQIASKKRFNVLLEFLSHFKSPLIIVLIIAAIVSAIFGETVDSIIIAVMIFLSVCLDFFLEYNAEKASEKLKAQVQTKATVRRSGKIDQIDYSELVPGDIILVSAGSIIPADARILSSIDLFVNQSSLTGESYPAEKSSAALKGNPAVNDQTNMLFFGTNVLSGSGTAMVVRTGKTTQFGRVAVQLAQADPETEFDRGINKFGGLVTKVIIVLVLIIFLFNSFAKHNMLESFMFAIAIAVGLVPELLPMIMTVTMARGSLEMSKGGVIVKRLSSIPNFGSMDVLCTDKTGTLTEDKIRLVKYNDIEGKDDEAVLRHAYINSHFQMGIKNPLDEAVLEYKNISLLKVKKLSEIPFDFIRKKMSVVVKDGSIRELITKGAPEEMFGVCTSYIVSGKVRRFDQKARDRAIKLYHKLSADGFRVLAVATRKIGVKKTYTKADEVDLTLLGFISFLDPPKADAVGVVKSLNEIGVEVKIVTGDNELVTRKICKELKIEVKGVMLGSEMAGITDDALKVRAEKTTIFARFSPDQKNRVILALKSGGHVVGYMGDGINDAPSLKTADIGISVNSAADVAKESADMVLTKKSLFVLKEGILRGRKTFSSTMKYIMMNLSSNFGNMFSVAGAVVFLPFLPMLPVQILLNNFIYDFSQVTIPSDNVDADAIARPKRWNTKFIRNFMLFFGPASSIFDFLTFFVLFSLLNLPEGAFQTGWFMESLATQTFVIYIIRTKNIPFIESWPSKPLLLSSLVCVTISWIIPFTPLGKFFGFVPLSFGVVMALVGIVIAYLLVVQGIKSIFYRYNEF